MRRGRRVGASALALAALAGCFSDRPDDPTGPNGDAVVVDMTTGLTFEPRTTDITVGQTVVWRNTSGFVHTATGDPSAAADPSHVTLPTGAEAWGSGLVPASGEYRKTFEVAGTYDYFCVPHEAAGMLGRVVVSN